MWNWLSANMINIVLITVIVLIVCFLIRGLIRDKKAGKSTCGGSCASCGFCSRCGACGKCSEMEMRYSKKKQYPGGS